VSGDWPYGTLPSLSSAQLDFISRLPTSALGVPSAVDLWADPIRRVLDASGWSSPLSNVAVDFLPSPNVIDALSQSVAVHDLVLHGQLTQVVSAQHSLWGLAAREDLSPAFTAVRDTLVRYGGVQDVLGSFLLELGRSADLLRGYSAPPAVRYDTLLDRLPGRPSRRRVAVAQHSGDVQSGLVVVESLTAPDLGENEATGLAEEFTELLIEPWREAPARIREALLHRLGELDPDIPELLAGGWDDVARAGPAAASKIAHCAAEVLSRTLRALAPDGDVIAWVHDQHPSDKSLLTDRGDPTRRARVRYALRGRPTRDRRLVESQIGAIEALVGLVRDTNDALQPAKHGSSVPVATAEFYLWTTESAVGLILSQIS